MTSIKFKIISENCELKEIVRNIREKETPSDNVRGIKKEINELLSELVNNHQETKKIKDESENEEIEKEEIPPKILRK